MAIGLLPRLLRVWLFGRIFCNQPADLYYTPDAKDLLPSLLVGGLTAYRQNS